MFFVYACILLSRALALRERRHSSRATQTFLSLPNALPPPPPPLWLLAMYVSASVRFVPSPTRTQNTHPKKLEVDQIYHLASPASPPHYQYNPIKTIKTSTQGTLNMLGLAKRTGARMLLTSTSEVSE